MIACNDCRWFSRSYGYSPAECKHENCFAKGEGRSAEHGVYTYTYRFTDFHEKNKQNDCEDFEPQLSVWETLFGRRK